MAITAVAGGGETLGERLRQLRDARGLSLVDAMTEARVLLPRALWITNETIRRYEKGIVPEDQADPVILAALAQVYNVPLADLSSAAHRACNQVWTLLGVAGGGTRPSPDDSDDPTPDPDPGSHVWFSRGYSPNWDSALEDVRDLYEAAA